MGLPWGILPIVTVETVSQAEYLTDILLDEGVTQLEIVFRSAIAPEAIETVRKKFPEMLIGAGTLKTLTDFNIARDAGAQFFISPCYIENISQETSKLGLDYVPGVASPLEAWTALMAGWKCLKFFPAQACGGLAWIKAVSAPFPEILWMPSGGISLDEARDYLKLAEVSCVGIGEIARLSDLRLARWDTIRNLAGKAGEINGTYTR